MQHPPGFPTFPSPLQLGGTRGTGRLEPMHGSPAFLSPYVVPKRSVSRWGGGFSIGWVL